MTHKLGRFQPCHDCCAPGSCSFFDYDFAGKAIGDVDDTWTLTGTWSIYNGFYDELRGVTGSKAVYALGDTDDMPSLFSVRIDWLVYVGHSVKLTVGNWEIIATITGGALPGVPYAVDAEFWENGTLREAKTCSLAVLAAGDIVSSKLCMFQETDGQLMVYLEAGGCNTFLTSAAMPADGEISFEVLDYDADEAPDGVSFIRVLFQDTTDPLCACPQGCVNCLYRRTATCYQVALSGMSGTWGNPPGCDSCDCINGTFYIDGGCTGTDGHVRHWRCWENNALELDDGTWVDGVDISLSWTTSQVAGKYRYQCDIMLVGNPIYAPDTIWTFYEDYDDKQPCDQALTLGLKATTGRVGRCAGSSASVTLTPVTDNPCPSDNDTLDHPCHFCDNCNDTPDELLLTASYPGYYTCCSQLSGQYVLTRSTAAGAWCVWTWASEDGNYDARFEITKVSTFIRGTVRIRKIGGGGGTCTLSRIVSVPATSYLDCQSEMFSGQLLCNNLNLGGSWSVEPA